MSQPEPEHGTGPDGRATREPSPTTADDETWKGKGVALRAFFYIFGTHLFAGFVWLLFYLGEHARK